MNPFEFGTKSYMGIDLRRLPSAGRTVCPSLSFL
jgi:hypothetical protein